MSEQFELESALGEVEKKEKSVASAIKHWQLPLLALAYVGAFLVFDALVENINRYFIFCNFLIVSSLYFSWSLGGREAMLYVAFFNMFFAFVFARLFAVFNVISTQLFFGKSFIVLYVVILAFMVLMLTRESPADVRRKKRDKSIQDERRMRHQLELMVATQKLTDDVIRQANRVKDELLLLQSSWRSQIHSIVNDLPPVKERELYESVVRPFQDDILKHLRGLEERLSFNPQPATLETLRASFEEQIKSERRFKSGKSNVVFSGEGWRNNPRYVVVDIGKTWEILLNLVRNSQTAVELRQIELLKTVPRALATFMPLIELTLTLTEEGGVVLVRDTGGGLAPDVLAQLFRRPLPSKKRGGKAFGQGTTFVKFFGESMGFSFLSQNIELHGMTGLEVAVIIPFAERNIVGAFRNDVALENS